MKLFDLVSFSFSNFECMSIFSVTHNVWLRKKTRKQDYQPLGSLFCNDPDNETVDDRSLGMCGF